MRAARARRVGWRGTGLRRVPGARALRARGRAARAALAARARARRSKRGAHADGGACGAAAAARAASGGAGGSVAVELAPTNASWAACSGRRAAPGAVARGAPALGAPWVTSGRDAARRRGRARARARGRGRGRAAAVVIDVADVAGRRGCRRPRRGTGAPATRRPRCARSRRRARSRADGRERDRAARGRPRARSTCPRDARGRRRDTSQSTSPAGFTATWPMARPRVRHAGEGAPAAWRTRAAGQASHCGRA